MEGAKATGFLHFAFPAFSEKSLSFIHYQVGSLRVVADTSGNVIKAIQYDPFGGIIEDSNPDFKIPLGFASGLHDHDLGFVRCEFQNHLRRTAPDPASISHTSR